MDPRLIWVLVAIAVIVIAAVVWFDLRRRRSNTLRARFGPEYNRTVANSGSITQAEASLEAHARGQATTEDLRQAMVHYRALFDDLLEATSTGTERERDMARGRR